MTVFLREISLILDFGNKKIIIKKKLKDVRKDCIAL